MPETPIKYYAEEPLQVEWSPDGVFWETVEHYDIEPAEGCMSAKVDVESGWIRAKYLFGNPEVFGTYSNAVAVPEPAWIGLWAGILMLILVLRRRSRAC